MRVLTNDEIFDNFTHDEYIMFYNSDGDKFMADLSGNLFHNKDGRTIPLNICIPELADTAEMGGDDD